MADRVPSSLSPSTPHDCGSARRTDRHRTHRARDRPHAKLVRPSPAAVVLSDAALVRVPRIVVASRARAAGRVSAARCAPAHRSTRGRTPVCRDRRRDRRRSRDWRGPTRSELAASVDGVAARVRRAVAASRSATRLDVRPEPRGAQDRRRTNDLVRLRRRRLSRASRQRARRSRTADDSLCGRVGDARRRAELGRDDPGAGGRADGGAKREPRGARLRDRSVVPARRIRTAALSAARRARHALHDRAPRPESRRQSSASRTGIDLAASCPARAADVARDAHRAVSPRDDGRARHCGDVEVLRATAALAAARGATPLIVVPQFNREDDVERTFRRRILDDAGLPYVFVEFDDGWRIPGDLHPNAATARRIAMAIADRLRATPTSGLTPQPASFEGRKHILDGYSD